MSNIEDRFPQEPEEKENISRDELDMTLENKALQDDLILRGMSDFYRADDLDPALENAFLNQVLDFEDASQEMGFITIAKLLPDGYSTPPADELDDEAMKAKMAEIRDILGNCGVLIGFNDRVPDRIAYEYFLNECLDEEIMGPVGMPGYTCHLDGCSGCCEECFQLAYCETGQELQNERKHK